MSDVALDQVAVRVKNIGVLPFEGAQARYANVQYQILPGQERFVPYQAAVMWFGNPLAKDNPAYPDDRDLQFRTLEKDRLSAYYGVYSQPWFARTPDETTPVDIDELKREVGGDEYVAGRHPNLPYVECWISKPEGDERLWTVIEDPDGERVGAVNRPAQAQDSDALAKQLRAVEAQVAKLQTQLAIAQPATDIADVDLEDDKADLIISADSDKAEVVTSPGDLEDPKPAPGSKATVDTPAGARAARKKPAQVG